MQKKLKKLLLIQLLIATILFLVGWFISQMNLLAGMIGGSFIAIATTIMAMLIFRRLPQVIPAKMFYTAMILNEVIKWLIVMVLTVLMLQYVSPPGLIIGFFMTYLAYFWLILVD